MATEDEPWIGFEETHLDLELVVVNPVVITLERRHVVSRSLAEQLDKALNRSPIDGMDNCPDPVRLLLRERLDYFRCAVR